MPQADLFLAEFSRELGLWGSVSRFLNLRGYFLWKPFLELGPRVWNDNGLNQLPRGWGLPSPPFSWCPTLPPHPFPNLEATVKDSQVRKCLMDVPWFCLLMFLLDKPQPWVEMIRV